MASSKELEGGPINMSVRGSVRAWLSGRKVAGEARGVIECSHSRMGEDEWDGFHEDCSKSDWLVREQREEEVDIIGA